MFSLQEKLSGYTKNQNRKTLEFFMYDKQELKRTAIQWISDWNERDIKKIMAHYADEVVFYSNTVTRRWGNADGM
jgi:hypothetical protein